MVAERSDSAAAAMRGRRFVSVEFMYRPRPTEARRQAVFDAALASRLAELARHPDAALMLCCANSETALSMAHLPAAYPSLPIFTALVNPAPHPPPYPDANTPHRCQWDAPAAWIPMQTTDRWARIRFALEVGRGLAWSGERGWLIMPAHDAVWGAGLLDALAAHSAAHSANGLPAALSALTFWQHSPHAGIPDGIPDAVIDALNLAFNRDRTRRTRIEAGEYQQFWGKMGMIPFGMCAPLLERADARVWEDDVELEGAIRAAGYAVRALWVDDPARYRQLLPVFDDADLRAVFMRTLHYSLNIAPGRSILTEPLDPAWRALPDFPSRWQAALERADGLIAGCQRAIEAKLARFGCSWVDWGAYRHVVRPGDPFVQVWKDARKAL